MYGHRLTRSRTRLLAAFGVGGLVVATSATAAIVAAPGAGASGSPDLSIAQQISGSTQKGHTFDTFVVKNHGGATASSVNVELFFTTKSTWRNSYSGSVRCEVMPAPKGYDDATGCQLTSSLAAGASVSFKADISGTAGAAFTSLAEVGDFQGDSNYSNNTSTRATYFGPATDLAVAGSDQVGTTHGHATANITVVNRGPNDAQHLQVVSELTNASGAVAYGHGGSCQIVPAAAGYSLASSCVVDLLKTGANYKIRYDVTGTSGKVVKVVTTATSYGTDPNSKNNKITRRSKAK
jgi:hypothetical protein